MFPSQPPQELPDGWSHAEWQHRQFAASTPEPWRSDEDLELLERSTAWTSSLPFSDPDCYSLGLAELINPS